MGSIIEVFPSRRGVATLADVWRAEPAAGPVRVRATRLEDYAAIRALQRAAHPYAAPWSLKQLESQIHAFPEGQFVAVSEGHVVGAAASLIVRWDEYAVDHTWKGITAEGHFSTHDAHGRTLYSADLVADTTRRGFGIARALFQSQRRLTRRCNLRRIIATARLPGYGPFSADMTPELYAMRVIWGDIADPAMRFKMSQGFQYCGILRGYMPEDTESCGNAALLAWLNPMYSPPGPPAFMAPERQLKSA
ncbi:MAG TPA: GNAT family N-acetyltransferase [Usitatibacter sp.]|nr:GNAT family N-acetyltransferase [Usitatibacter sp.]